MAEPLLEISHLRTRIATRLTDAAKIYAGRA